MARQLFNLLKASMIVIGGRFFVEFHGQWRGGGGINTADSGEVLVQAKTGVFSTKNL
jgi:hypothetical protein